MKLKKQKYLKNNNNSMEMELQRLMRMINVECW